MTRAVLTRLTLTDFRSYERAEIALDGRPVYLAGPNGAGKTNLLEAVSLLTAGRGLRGAAIAEIGRRLPGEARRRAWAVAATDELRAAPVRLGTGPEQPGLGRGRPGRSGTRRRPGGGGARNGRPPPAARSGWTARPSPPRAWRSFSGRSG